MDYTLKECWNCDEWKLLENIRHETEPVQFNFTMADMLQYFIHRKALDGLASNDFKDVNTKAFPLFKAGHIQYVYYRGHNEKIFMKCTCMPEMKKGLTYRIHVVFQMSGEIEFAVCGCPAGRGPMCMCKHLAAFCYFIEEFCRTSSSGQPQYLSSTSSLQQWHQPRKRSSSPCRLDNIKFTKAVYGKESSKAASTTYDPRPEQLRVTTFEEIYHLRQSLEAMQTPVALLHVLPLPSQRAMNSPAADNDTGNVQVNHSDPALPHIPRSAQFRVQTALKREPQPVSLAALHKHMMDFMKMIMYCQEDCQRIEVATRRQSKCVRWHEERHCRVTSSNFSSLCKSITTCKVKSLLYSDNKSTLSSSAILWGRLHEKSAFDQYQSTFLPENSSLRESGIYISKYGFIAASPDGVVETNGKVCGVIEIKCPYSCRTMSSVREACCVKSFCCEIVDEKVQLKRNHQYYFQVQGSMALVGVQWCDFIIWLINDMTVERIHFDPTFWQKCFEQLKNNYLTCILPEIIYPRVSIGQEIIQYPVSSDIKINYFRSTYISLESEP